jgi:hypothetical protein
MIKRWWPGRRFWFKAGKGTREGGVPSQTGSGAGQLVAVDNWFEELKRLAPPDAP